MPERNGEIDLLELFAKTILLVKKNAKIILLAFIIGTVLGLCYYQFVPKVYESKMILFSDILTLSYSERITESLDQLILEKNTEILSEKLKMSEQDAKQIAKFEIENVKRDKIKDGKENEIFIVTVKVLDKNILLKLQEKIINYLRNNEYVRIRVELKKKYTIEIIKKIEEELLALEQLKIKITNGEFVRGAKGNLVLFDPTTVHSKIVELNKERTLLKNTLETINSIQLVEGFTVFEKPVSPKLSYSLAGGASFGLFFVGMVIAFKGIRKMINFSEQKLGQP
jgi:uncharacterized protein involved in exopolysaccharide biosynthesis